MENEDNKDIVKTEVTNEVTTEENSEQSAKGPRTFGRKTFGKPFNSRYKTDFQDDITTQLISLRAVSKTRTGGRRRSFAVLMIAGNKKGLIGSGTGKSTDVVDAIKKAERQAKKNLVRVCLKDKTITHNVRSYFCGVSIIANRMKQGTGLKAGGVTRKVLSLAGIEDISCKCIGNRMAPHNVVYGLIEALSTTNKVSEIASRLNLEVKDILERGR